METVLSIAAGQEAPPSAADEKRLLLSRLLARLAHEVRNPLSSLDIHVQLLQEDIARAEPAMRDKTNGRLAIIRGELKRLEEIVESFLRLSGPSVLKLSEVEVKPLIDHVCELVQPEASGRGIEIRVRCERAIPVLLADAGQLTQALLNVVLNALQAIRRRGRIEIRVGLNGTDAMRLEVRDSGPGVSEPNRAAIFEPYFTTKEDGTGLGLWIARQIATAHGGTLQVINAPEGGAVFTFYLPIKARTNSHGQV